ncbi:MAG: ester cyclase [Candidatus Omnitrophota bacterium]
MNKEEQIKSGIDQLIERGNLDVVKTIFSTDYIAHAGDKDYKGHAFIKKFTKQIRSAIPDIKIISVEFLVKTSNTVTWLRTLSGTHKENMRGIPPSGKKVKWQDMVVSRFQEGKIAEEWVVSELAGELALKQPRKK